MNTSRPHLIDTSTAIGAKTRVLGVSIDVSLTDVVSPPRVVIHRRGKKHVFANRVAAAVQRAAKELSDVEDRLWLSKMENSR